MAGINWGQLSPIAAPQVVAQLPSVAPQPSAGDYAGAGISGLMQGIQQGQAIKMNGLQIQQAEQQMQDQQELRGAGTPDKWMAVLAKQGRFDDILKYQTQQELYQGALLNNKSSLLDLNQKEREKADRDNVINVQVMGQVSQLPPEQRQQAYQQYRTDLMQKYPDIVMPEEFNENSFASVMRTNEVYQATVQQESTEKVKTLIQLQQLRHNLNETKQKYIAEKKPTDEIDLQLKETQKLINTHSQNVQTQSQEKVAEEATKKKIEVSAEGLKSAQKASRMADNMEPILDDLEKVINDTSDKNQGPIAGLWAEYVSENAQTIESKQGLITSMLRQLMEFPAAGFSDADREMLAKIGASKWKDKRPNLEAIQALRSMLKRAKQNLQDYQEEYDKEFGTSAKPSLNPVEEQMRKRGLLK